MRIAATTLLFAAALTGTAAAQEGIRVPMNKVTAEGIGDPVGVIVLTQTDGGVQFAPELRGLPPGERGFHVHETGNCGPGPNPQGEMTAGMAAGDHWDPEDTGAHRGPEGDGHRGDAPVITVAADGTATGAVVAPHITNLADLRGKALMIHAGGDNYSDEPEPLGGGGGRIACGVIE